RCGGADRQYAALRRPVRQERSRTGLWHLGVRAGHRHRAGCVDQHCAGTGGAGRCAHHFQSRARGTGGRRPMSALTQDVQNFFSTPVHIAIGAIYALLILASLISFALRKLSPGAAHTELSQRVRSWWWMITVFTVAILTSRVVSSIFLGFMSFLALKEYFSLIPTRRVDRGILLFAYLALPVQFYFAHVGSFGMFMVFIPVW